MATRKIKDAKDTTTNEVIYFKGHAKATYMSDGRSVEDAIYSIGSGGGEGGITQESDPLFRASAAAGITSSDIAAWNNKSDFSGNYNDLSNKPTIPSAVTKDTVTHWGFTMNNGTVTGVKINGVTKSPNTSGLVDLGTIESGGGTTVINGITDVIVDGVSVVSDNVATIPLASTSNAGVVQLSSALNSNNSSMAATPAAVKSVNDKVNGKQDTIDDLAEIRSNAANAFKGSINGVSEGTLWLATKVNGIAPNGECEVTIPVGDENVQSDWNVTDTYSDAYIKNKPTFKTINNQSIIGSGNIVVSSGGAPAYSLVNHGASDTTFTLTPNTFHVWGAVSALTLPFGESTQGIVNEYIFQFTCQSTPTTLALPENIKWATGSPSIQAFNTYQVSIVNNLATVIEFEP